MSVNVLFQIVTEENNIIRSIWTKNIVGDGLKNGENWKERHTDEGPLPALFLREVSKHLEKSPAALSLFLGSDFPISEENTFFGVQSELFNQIKKTKHFVSVYDKSIERYVAMLLVFKHV